MASPLHACRDRSRRRDQDEVGHQSVQELAGIKQNHYASAVRPIVHEYYGATEGLGFTSCNSDEWLAHRGTVGTTFSM
jgi:hypothetical protein